MGRWGAGARPNHLSLNPLCRFLNVLGTPLQLALDTLVPLYKPYRRSLIGYCAAIIATCFAFPLLQASERSPNVLLIVADDLGFQELGCFGQQRIGTPHLDRLATQGMRLTQHYAGSPVCAPSRCVLMTGKHPGHAYIRNNSEAQPEGQLPLPDSQVTLAEVFQGCGYVTGAFGKWGLGGPDSTGEPLRQGFDRFFGYNCQRYAHTYYPDYLWNDRQRIGLDNHPPVPGHAGLEGADPADANSYRRFQGQDYAPLRIHQQALQFIRQHRDRPFFLYYPTTLPHLALQVPDAEVEPYRQLGWDDPPFTRERGGYTPHFTPRAAYAAMISLLDRFVGELLAELEACGLSDETIVIFTSDNGTTHVRDEVDYEFFQSVGPLRGLKGSLYEGGVRVPTIVRWPGHVPAGSSSDRLSGFEDWMSTLLDLIGQQPQLPDGTDGVSFAPTLLSQPQPDRDFLYREFSGYGGQQSIRVGDWKVVRQNISRRDATLELYNLADDIGESNNLAAQHPDIIQRLTTLMQQCHQPSDLFPLLPDRP
ncbi:MAG: arylsulfatase [Pirellulaceae bacterium]|nr:arylsulfatase [Pirellulaceae bacterium]